MASLHPSFQDIFEDRSGLHFVVTKVKITGSSDTVTLPEGLGSSAHVAVVPKDSSDTAPAVTSITQNAHPQGATLTLAAGGTANADMFIFSVHSGNASGL